MDPKTLSETLAVTGQVQLADIPQVAASFATLINNRPDGEEPGQPTSAEIEAAARQAGLAYAYIPLSGQDAADEQVAAFAGALADNPTPALAFCRSGRRSALLWALSQAVSRSPSDLLSTAANAGYDLAFIEPRLKEAAPHK